MASPPAVSPKLKFGEFEVDAAAGKLFRAGVPIKLQPQPMKVLLLLMRQSGQVVTREEVRRSLWGETTFVDFEHGINFSVNQIRAALCDDAEKPRYIETLPRIGYRFIASVAIEGRGNSAKGLAVHQRPGGAQEWLGDPGIASEVGAGSASQIPAAAGKRFHAATILVAVVVALGAASYVALKHETRTRGPSLQKMQITKLTDNGTAEDMAISPDGSYVVYALRDGEKESLRLRQVATRRDIEILPTDTNGFHGLTFSRDGNYIYFVRSDKNDPFFKYLYRMPALGGSPRKLITDVDSPVSFSPDGQQFVYEHCIPVRNELELRIAATGGGSERSLAAIAQTSCSLFQPGPAWSQDGRTIIVPVFLSGVQQRWVLYSVDVPSRKLRQLYSSPYDMGRPAWLATGNAALMPHYDPSSGREQLWTISFPGGQARRLTNDLSEYGTALDITRSGGSAAGITKNMISNVWEVSAGQPSSPRQVTYGNLPFTDVAYAADGRILSGSTDGRLWVMNTDGSERTVLADEAGWLTPCGQSVVFAAYKGGTVTLMRINPDGSNATKLVSDDLWKPSRTSFSTRAPVCSPDGKFVFFVNANGPRKICRVPIGGGPPVEIAEVSGDFIAGRLGVSPDGTLLAYLYEQYTGTATPGWKLAVIPVRGGPMLKILEVPGGIGGPRWSLDGKALQYLLTQDGTTNIWEQPLTGGQPRQLTSFKSGQIFDFNWSSDHHRLLLTRGTKSSDVILLNNLQ